MHYPLTDIQADFEINRSIRYQVTAKIHYLHRRTDKWTDRRTGGQYVVFIEKNIKNNKNEYMHK